MLRFSLVFLILAVAAALLAFGGFVAGILVAIAKALFFLFIVLWLITMFAGRRRAL
jgi:uncharacterized membrane protein YtjA (UPF0391 family)